MLSSTELRRFEKHGFLGPYGLRPLPSCCDSNYLSMSLRTIGKPLDPYIFRNQHLVSKSLLQVVTRPEILERVKAILGPDVLLWIAQIIPRLPGFMGHDWHSDSINQYLRGVHISLALSEMTVKNGCIKLIPRTHLYRSSLCSARDTGMSESSDAAWADLADKTAPWHAPHRVLHLELKAGQFFLMWGGLWHAVGPNRTNTPRTACIARFARPDVTCRDYGYSDNTIVAGAKLPCVMVSGQDMFGLNDTHEPPAGDIYSPSSK
jgi:non-heme Fe2+,alpha-ketoglutarate-dependent halogenase